MGNGLHYPGHALGGTGRCVARPSFTNMSGFHMLRGSSARLSTCIPGNILMPRPC